MLIPDEKGMFLKDRFFDLRGLSAYSSLSVGCLRDHLRESALPYFKIKGKILIKRSKFDCWLEHFRGKKGQDIEGIVNDVMDGLKR